MKALTTIYPGGIVALDRTVGFAMPAAEAPDLVVVGLAEPRAFRNYDNSLGASGGEVNVTVRQGEFELDQDGSIGIADAQSQAYLVDDHTVSLIPGANAVKCGQIVQYVSATVVRVLLVPGWI
jgi:hypothetical protein